MPEFRPVYRNRGQAYREFIRAQGLPVSERKFYDDAAAFVAPDKSVSLVDLLAYVRTELKVDPIAGTSLRESPAHRERERRRAEVDDEKAEEELKKIKLQNRREDERWIEKVEHEIQMAAFAGAFREALKQQTDLRLPELVHAVGQGGAAGLFAALEELFDAAGTDAVRVGVRVVEFEDETGSDEQAA